MFNMGQMKIAAIQLYGDFMTRVATTEEEGYRRYRGLMDFLGGIGEDTSEGVPVEKTGAEEDYKEQYEREKERSKSRARIGDKIGRAHV